MNFFEDEASQDITVPLTNTDFLTHPDLRSVAIFFLGWTFFCALQCLAVSLRNSRILSRRWDRRRAPFQSRRTDIDVEQKNPDAADSNDSIASPSTRDLKNLVLVLTTTTMAATFGNFFFLLDYRKGNADVSCAFLAAWSGLTGQAAKSLGFAKLVLHLREFGIGNVETIGLWVGIIISVSLSFVQQAMGVGVTSAVSELPGLFLCYRSHSLGPALASSLFNIVMELYLMLRLFVLIVPEFLLCKHQLEATLDYRLARALSLFLLDVMSILPHIIQANVLLENIPFSIGFVLVLMAFNYRPRTTTSTIAVSLSASPGSVVVIDPPSMLVAAENSTRSSSIAFASSKSSSEEADSMRPSQQPRALSTFLLRPALRAFPSSMDTTSPMHHLQVPAERDDSPPRLRLVTPRDSSDSSIMTRRVDPPSPKPVPAYPPPSPPGATMEGREALDSTMEHSSVIYGPDIVRRSDGEPFPDALRGNPRRLTKSTPDTRREDREAVARLVRDGRSIATALTRLSYQERDYPARHLSRLPDARPLRYHDIAVSRSLRSSAVSTFPARRGLRDSSHTFGHAAPELPPMLPELGRTGTPTPPVTAFSQSSFGTFEIVTLPHTRAVLQASRPRALRF